MKPAQKNLKKMQNHEKNMFLMIPNQILKQLKFTRRWS